MVNPSTIQSLACTVSNVPVRTSSMSRDPLVCVATEQNDSFVDGDGGPSSGSARATTRATPITAIILHDRQHFRHSGTPCVVLLRPSPPRHRCVRSASSWRRRPKARPTGRFRPRWLISRVADAYRSAAAESSRAAVVLAEETMSQLRLSGEWIKERAGAICSPRSEGSRRMSRRSRGEGSIYQRESDGKWVGAVTLENGRRRVVYGATQRDRTTSSASCCTPSRTGYRSHPGGASP